MLKRSVLAAALALIAACRHSVSVPLPTSAINTDVEFLASAALAGRESGTAGADSAADFLARRYRQLRLRPAFVVQCRNAPCPQSYFQPFSIASGVARNVGTIVDGSDSSVRARFIVLGAHYDHLGRSPTYALDRTNGYTIRAGADDNASGTAALLELARRLRDRPTRRSILILNFDAEELGLVGSRVFLKNSPVPQSAMTFMLNLDMIGRLRNNRLYVEGARDGQMRALIDSAVASAGLRADYVENAGLSDDATFLREGVRAIGISTGNHADYHTAQDVAARINYAGAERVVDVAERIIRRVADQ